MERQRNVGGVFGVHTGGEPFGFCPRSEGDPGFANEVETLAQFMQGTENRRFIELGLLLDSFLVFEQFDEDEKRCVEGISGGRVEA